MDIKHNKTTTFPGEVVEMALAHTIRDRTEAAYRRGDLLERRRPLMLAWERYCVGSSAEVIDIAARR